MSPEPQIWEGNIAVFHYEGLCPAALNDMEAEAFAARLDYLDDANVGFENLNLLDVARELAADVFFPFSNLEDEADRNAYVSLQAEAKGAKFGIDPELIVDMTLVLYNLRTSEEIARFAAWTASHRGRDRYRQRAGNVTINGVPVCIGCGRIFVPPRRTEWAWTPTPRCAICGPLHRQAVVAENGRKHRLRKYLSNDIPNAALLGHDEGALRAMVGEVDSWPTTDFT